MVFFNQLEIGDSVKDIENYFEIVYYIHVFKVFTRFVKLEPVPSIMF